MLNTHAINIKKSPPPKKNTEPPRPATDAAPAAEAPGGFDVGKSRIR